MGGLEGWILIAVLLVLSLLLGLAGMALFFAVGAWFLRRRKGAKATIANEPTLIKAPAPSAAAAAAKKSAAPVAAAPLAPPPKPMPAPLTPANVVRGGTPTAVGDRRSSLDATVNLPPPVPGFALPPPPPPFQAGTAAPPPKPQPLHGFFDDDATPGGGEEAKTELFSRDAAKRYAEMLDDEEDEGHTELFSKESMGDLAAGFLDDSDPGRNTPKPPGRLVADKK